MMTTKNKIILGMFFLVASLILMQNVLAVSDTIYLEDYKVEYSYSGAQEDDTFTLTVTITNEDNSNKTDVYFEIDSSDPFDVDGDEEWDIGDLADDESVSKSFRIEVDEDTDEGKYDLEFNLEDDDDDFSDEFDIEVDSDKADLIIGDVSSFPLIIMPDEEDIKLELSIENIGGGDASFVRAELILPSGFSASSSYSDNVNLGTIESGDSKTATFYIDTAEDLASGLELGKLRLEYKTDGDKQTDELNFDLPVKGKPLFSIVSSSISPSEIYAGAEGSLRIQISNIGEDKGEETSIRVFENSDLPLSFDEKTSFIGNLETGQTGSAVFNFEVDSDANVNNYLVKIQVRTLSNDNILVSEYSVPVKISQKESSGVGIYTIIGMLVLVVSLFGFAIVKLAKKPKSKKKSQY